MRLGGKTNLVNVFRDLEVRSRDAVDRQGRPEFFERLDDPFRVVRRRPHEHVEIARRARQTMRRERMSSDDHEFDMPLDQAAEQIDEVFV